MKRSLYAIPVMLCLAAVSVGAQDKPAQPTPDKPPTAAPPSPPSPSQQPSKPAESSTSAANKATYTGCVKPGTAPGSWILEDAEAAQKAGASGSTVGTSGAKMTFSLTPSSSVDLKPHANHKIEVVGTVSAARPSAGADPAAAPSASAPKQQIAVESVKMVSATCP